MKKIYFYIGILVLVALVSTAIFFKISRSNKDVTNAQLSCSLVEVGKCVLVEETSNSSERSKCALEAKALVPDSRYAHNEREIKPIGRVFHLVGTNIPMTFVDGNWSAELKNLVHEDMNLVFSHLTNYEIVNDPHPPKAYQLDGEAVISTHYISFKGRGRFWPDEYDSERCRLISKEGGCSLVVSEDLLAAYELALEFKQNNNVMFDRLDEFIDTLNNPKEVDRISKNAQLSREMFYFYGERPWEKDSTYQKNMSEIKTLKIRKPSILSFHEKDHNGEKVIIATPLISSREDTEFFTDFPQFCYVSNKWYTCIPRLP